MTTEWRPIATYTDGPSIQIVLVSDGSYVTAAWLRELEEGGVWTDAVDAPDHCDNTIKPQPTHWMPMPKPPGRT